MQQRTQRGPDVGRWQPSLIGQGLLNGTADGIFGDQTDAATRAFQGRECLEVDGLVGRTRSGAPKHAASSPSGACATPR